MIKCLFLEKNPDYGIVGGWYHIIDDKGLLKKTMTPHTSNEQIKLGLLFRNQFAQPTVTGRTELFKGLKYDISFKCAEDYDLWIRFAQVSKVANLPHIYLSYRWHENNTCNTKQTELRLFILNLFSRELDKLQISYDEHELMLHLAVSFGMGQYLIKDDLKKQRLLNWYNKVFSSLTDL